MLYICGSKYHLMAMMLSGYVWHKEIKDILVGKLVFILMLHFVVANT